MKQLGWIWIVVILAVSACARSGDDPVETRRATSLQINVSPELAAIDSLMWRQSDSALTLLLPWFDTCCMDAARHISTATVYNRYYAHVLLSELLYKNYCEQTNREDLLLAVDYFDSLCCRDVSGNVSTTAFLDARAHYINGIGYYEHDSLAEACAQLLKALEVMESHFEEKELVGNKARFMALTCTRLTNLFSNDYLQEQALYFGKLSLKYYQKYDADPSHIAWILNELGFAYYMMEQLDSSNYYYSCAMDILPDTIHQTFRDIAARQTLLSYKKDHQPEKSVAVLHRLAYLAVSERERLARYLAIGDIYYYEGQFDSAWFYLKQVYDNTSAPDSRMLAAERLQEISIKNGDTLKTKEYALARSQYVTVKDKDGKLHSTLTGLCQQYEQNKQEIQHRLKVQKAKRQWGTVLGIVLALAAVVSVFLTLSRKRNKRLQTEKEDVGRLLETERHTHKMQQAALAGRLKKSNEELRDVSMQLEQTLAKTPSESMPPDDYASYVNSAICQYIVGVVHEQQFKSKMDYLVYKDSALSKEQLLSLRDAAEKHLPRFVSQIRKQFSRLTESDMDYCYLFLLGLSEADVSALMQRAYTTVCDRSRKISRIIGANDSLYQALRGRLSE